MQRVRHANRGRLLLRTPGPVPLWDLHVLWCRDRSLLNLSCLRTFEFRTPLGTSLLLCSRHRVMVFGLHILIECVVTAEIRKGYFNCPDLKTVFNSVAGDTILAFFGRIKFNKWILNNVRFKLIVCVVFL